MGVALGSADGHARRLGDLLERVAHRVLEDDHLRFACRDAGERVAQLAAELGHAGLALRVRDRAGAEIVLERLVHARLAPLGGVTARVDDETVEPRGELRVAAELRQAQADLRERFLRGVARILRVPEQMTCQPLDARGVPCEQRLERQAVAVLRPGDEDRVAELLVDEVLPAQRLADGLHSAISLVARVGSLTRGRGSVVTWTPRSALSISRRDAFDAA